MTSEGYTDRGRILVLGESCSDNLGDRLIAEGVRTGLQRLGRIAVVEPLSGRLANVRPGGLPATEGVIRRQHRRLRAASIHYRHVSELLIERELRPEVADYRSFEAVFLGGGQLVLDNSLRMLRTMNCVSKLASETSTPCCLVGVGVASPRSLIARKILSSILARMPQACFVVRDTRSASILYRFLNAEQRSRLIVAPDMAFIYLEQRFGSSAFPSGKTIGLAPIAATAVGLGRREVAEEDRRWINLYRRLEHEGYDPVFVSNGTFADQSRIQRIAQQDSRNITLMDRPTTSESLLNYLEGFGGLVAQRLHMNIAFYGSGGAPVGISWDPKVDSFFSSINLEERCLRDVKDVDRVVNLLRISSRPRSVDSLASAAVEGLRAALP